MNSSAKTTTFSFLAAAALGAAVFMGCTVTSGTVDDTDGGNNNNNNNKEDAGSQSETGTPDTGGGGETCESPQTSKFQPESCQACLEGKCCLELKNCFNLPGDDDAGKVNCDGFKVCLDECAAKPEAEQETCNTECQEVLAAPGVVDAYKSIFTCGEQNCAAECLE